ncbi:MULTISPECIES: bifunctional acetate--CoA ligase family protein/GNAT family N-acetyltransferase [Vibrio]|uniref:Bifunctional acetate--CoA ligase family protein/GNAT family N-acetyltransferase n=1 Tax=Vibrio aestuarianus TaxID=28171 RepID=A0A9X4F8W9_9VIBR|nr:MULTISPECIES: bifunctional acetate--CoA ligase family protein/GNAT family N-acetyltransferase [Vibrio]MDE1235045.1 bifunctional acetate--CoA ligase family protein/GNAT family N-acetyltransferase [Vibrio aestuarianus]MDE1246126.1 bifunctional acetate--CoA ligase family protein/GNAT family N-acetyltransferase [Vibrio aestuarianus]MDE1333339.1 bifunctional acetate--CoA ligase family protein/GNAT family N-acetyltransferase [Vibrio aestuarianus]MDE1347238.1 bifunctional acetate--CoA ligase family
MNNLSPFLKPKSIAVIGASVRPFRAGNIVMKNLLQGGFDGAIMPVTPYYPSVCGVLAYKTIDALPIVPDIAILCTHATRNVAIFKQLAAKGISSVIVLSSDMYKLDDQGIEIQKQCSEIAKSAAIRVLGPNSLGLILPWLNFNASFSPVTALKGNIAFISQSAAVCTTILDWANDKQIGFSAFISLGNASDIDFADLLDCLSTDRHTDAILLYVDTIKDARRFMSAARAASRNRRILVLKGGRTLAGRKAAQAHTGGDDTLDIIYDSAIKRTGMLRVNNTHELFAAVETLTHSVPLRGERLAIITNGGGPAIMAVDTLLERGGKLAELEEHIFEKLNQCLPDSWSHSNPIDMVGDADHTRYVNTLNALLDSDEADAILIMHSPSAIAQSEQTAQAVVDAIRAHPRHKHFNILTNWSGELTARPARQIFTQAGIPTYRTPESAVVAFMHLVEYRRNQKQLMETPTTAEPVHVSEIHTAQQWIIKQLGEQSTLHLDTHQIGTLFKCFNFDVLPTWIASDASEAIHIAEQIGYPVAVKLRSPDIAHKSDVQGVMLNLRNSHEVANAAQAILDRTQLSYPSANIHGLLVQGMAKLAGGEELRIKVKTDATFGPVILLGQGGSEWDEAIDAAAALPPLNMTLARYLIVRAIRGGKIRLQKLPEPMNVNGLSEFLVRISQMIIDCPQIHELDIHPVLANGSQFTILDADLILKPFQGDGHSRLAIRPYPSELEERVTLRDNSVVMLRPILPEDEPQHAEFIHNVSKEDLYKRFFSDVGEFNHEALANFTQIDYDREMAFVAVDNNDGEGKIIGVSRALINPENTDAEFAILIRSDLKGNGLGKILLQKVIDYCRLKGTVQISGMTMPTNRGMLTLAQKLGFEVDIHFEDGTADMVLVLNKV